MYNILPKPRGEKNDFLNFKPNIGSRECCKMFSWFSIAGYCNLVLRKEMILLIWSIINHPCSELLLGIHNLYVGAS